MTHAIVIPLTTQWCHYERCENITNTNENYINAFFHQHHRTMCVNVVSAWHEQRMCVFLCLLCWTKWSPRAFSAANKCDIDTRRMESFTLISSLHFPINSSIVYSILFPDSVLICCCISYVLSYWFCIPIVWCWCSVYVTPNERKTLAHIFPFYSFLAKTMDSFAVKKSYSLIFQNGINTSASIFSVRVSVLKQLE